MALLVEQKSSSFAPMPEGIHEAVFSEVKDLGEKPDQYNPGKMKRTIAARLTNAAGQEATRFYTPSLHEKATLAKDLVILKGSVPATFDIETMVGVQCKVLVTAGVNGKGQPTAKVEKILKPGAGQKVGFKAKSAVSAPPAPPAAVAMAEITDDDIPF